MHFQSLGPIPLLGGVSFLTQKLQQINYKVIIFWTVLLELHQFVTLTLTSIPDVCQISVASYGAFTEEMHHKAGKYTAVYTQ